MIEKQKHSLLPNLSLTIAAKIIPNQLDIADEDKIKTLSLVLKSQ